MLLSDSYKNSCSDTSPEPHLEDLQTYTSLALLKSFVLQSASPEIHATYSSKSQPLKFVLDALRGLGVRSTYWTEGEIYHLKMTRTRGDSHSRLVELFLGGFLRKFEAMGEDAGKVLVAVTSSNTMNDRGGQGTADGGFDFRGVNGRCEILLRVEIVASQSPSSEKRLEEKMGFWRTTPLLWLLIVEMNYFNLHEPPTASLTWWRRTNATETFQRDESLPTVIWAFHDSPSLVVPLEEILSSYSMTVSGAVRTFDIQHYHVKARWDEMVVLEIERRRLALEREESRSKLKVG